MLTLSPTRHNGSDPSRLLRYLTTIPVVGGLAESVHGIQEMLHAQTHDDLINGQVDTAMGVTGSVGNAASLPIYANLMTAVNPTLLAVAGPVCGVACGFSSFTDGARDMYMGHKAHDPATESIGGVKMVASGLTASGAFSGNVILMAAGTLVYLGAIAYQNREPLESVYHKVEGWVHRTFVPVRHPTE